MSFYVYILLCSDNSYYTGHTENLESRIAAHQEGEISGYTQSRRPVKLAFSEEFPRREDALERERQLKKWSRAKKQALIDRDWQRLVELSRSRAGDKGKQRNPAGRPSTSSGRTVERAQPIPCNQPTPNTRGMGRMKANPK